MSGKFTSGRVAAALVSGLLLGPGWTSAGSIFVNEFHYDNTVGDVNEFIEIAVPDGTDISQMQVVLYNGANGQTYNTTNLVAFNVHAIAGPFTLYSRVYPINGIENGAPDGFAIVDNGSVVQFLSYEGTFTALNGPAAGMLSTAIPIGESGTGPITGSLGLTGTGNEYDDFTWQLFSNHSRGIANANQVFTQEAVPVPLPPAALAGITLIGGVGLSRMRRRGRG